MCCPAGECPECWATELESSTGYGLSTGSNPRFVALVNDSDDDVGDGWESGTQVGGDGGIPGGGVTAT